MEPNSILVLGGLALVAVGLLVVIVRVQNLAVRVLSGALALTLAATAGMAMVNDYYGYYQSWTQLSADLSGSYGSFANTTIASRAVNGTPAGRLIALPLPGPTSGITRGGFVYLPPQYFQPRYARTAFPVVELLHGTPGKPTAWFVHLNVVSIADHLIAERRMGPVVLVMPTTSVGHNFQECVDAPGALDDTYITHDVRADVQARFRVSRDPAQWGVAGYSSGGYCAANLALRHPGAFGASGVMDGYYRPQDGPAAAALHNDPAAESANNPLGLAAALTRDARPLPAFWISAGTGVAADINGALAFTRALHGVEQVPLYRERDAGHNFYAWQPALPQLLSWMWQQLAPPDLRVQFPIAGGVQTHAIYAPGAQPTGHSRNSASMTQRQRGKQHGQRHV